MAKIKESQKDCSETYTVKFWYSNKEGLYVQDSVNFYCNSKSAHNVVEKYFIKNYSNKYSNITVVSVTYN